MNDLKSLSVKVAASIAVGLLCSALIWVPQIGDLEREVGLRWLFQLRGPLEPPQNVVLVTMSQDVASNIHLPIDPEKYQRCIDVRIGPTSEGYEGLPPIPARWPRCLHAQLIEKLNRAGAKVIVFDVLFRQRAPQVGLGGDVNAQQDSMLAGAMHAAGNVLIAQNFEQRSGEAKTAEDRPVQLSGEIKTAALGAGPFQLIPSANRRVDRYDAFKEEGWMTPGLPVLALQAYAMETYPALRDMLAKESRDAADLLPATVGELREGPLQVTSLLLRQIIKNDQTLADRQLQSAGHPRSVPIDALISAYAGDASRLLNFLGPAGRIPSIGFDQVLALPNATVGSRPNAFMDKVVFVGYAEVLQAEQLEQFNTVYSSGNAIDMSGMEIAATAFLNLLDDSSIRPAAAWSSALVSFIAAFTATLLCLLLDLRIAIPAAMVIAAGYLGLAVHLFATSFLWMAIVIPLCVSTPAGIAYATAHRYVEARRQRDRVRAAFRHFVPLAVADELERNASRIVATRKSLECVCVATDAARFTTLAESMESEALTDFLNAYFDSLFKPVIENDGFVSDVVGDAMLAIWPEHDATTRQVVCTALLEMREAADDFNRRAAGDRLVTRFGANWGRVTLATVGAREHYEYRAVGDPVNTASRIQELNKVLGTRILVSQSLITGVEGYVVRDLGWFLLRGKAAPDRIFELVQKAELATVAQLELVSGFEIALETLHAGDKAAALAAFRDLKTHYPADGVTAFFVDYLLANRPLSGNAVQPY